MLKNNQDHVPLPERQIRAVYDTTTIRVYQAYSDVIANAALAHGTFTSPPFKIDRMTWIKPSFLWMMYRAGWGQKEAGQARILAIDISREGFEWALAHSCPSHPAESISKEEWQHIKENTPVRLQWDPERNLMLEPQPHRAIQIGLSKKAVELYMQEWIKCISDITPLAREINGLVAQRKFEAANDLLPAERPYDVEVGSASYYSSMPRLPNMRSARKSRSSSGQNSHADIEYHKGDPMPNGAKAKIR